ncbi:hypothetical protein CRYUN_Cryun39dG0075400 [Craigia yunnanensis]
MWIPPPHGYMKFSKGKLGPTGIGGVLRDNLLVVKMVFSKSVGMEDSNMAELLAVRKAMCLFISSCWAPSHKLIIESDSSNVVNWIHNPQSVPWLMKRIISHIVVLKVQIKECEVLHILRECNDMADGLSKAGVSRRNNLLVYYG